MLCIPEKDAILLRLGRTPVDEIDYVWDRLNAIGESL